MGGGPGVLRGGGRPHAHLFRRGGSELGPPRHTSTPGGTGARMTQQGAHPITRAPPGGGSLWHAAPVRRRYPSPRPAPCASLRNLGPAREPEGRVWGGSSTRGATAFMKRAGQEGSRRGRGGGSRSRRGRAAPCAIKSGSDRNGWASRSATPEKSRFVSAPRRRRFSVYFRRRSSLGPRKREPNSTCGGDGHDPLASRGTAGGCGGAGPG